MGCVDFDAARRERRNEAEPYQFKLGGETFTVRAVIALGRLWVDETPAAPERFTPTTDNGRAFLTLARAIAAWLPVEDHDRWWAIFDDPTDVEADDLFAVQTALMQEVAGRTPLSSNGSAGGPRTPTGSKSNAKPAKTSGARGSSTSQRAKASPGSSGSRTGTPRKRATSTSTTGSKGATKK